MTEERSGCVCDASLMPCIFCKAEEARYLKEKAALKEFIKDVTRERKEKFLEDLDDLEFCRKVMEKFGFIGKPEQDNYLPNR